MMMRDAETIDLLTDFLAESDESIVKVDEILLRAGGTAVGSEEVNELFRIFHTLKGVAGFLDLPDVVSLAHATETLLGRTRDGALTLGGVSLEKVFAATAKMRDLLGRVHIALSTGGPVEPAELSALCAAIEADEADLD